MNHTDTPREKPFHHFVRHIHFRHSLHYIEITNIELYLNVGFQTDEHVREIHFHITIFEFVEIHLKITKQQSNTQFSILSINAIRV